MLMKGQVSHNLLTPEEAQNYPLTEMDRMTIKKTVNCI